MTTHEQTIANYGCNNSERMDGYFAPHRLETSALGHFQISNVWIVDSSSKECRYDNRQSDKRCEGCKK